MSMFYHWFWWQYESTVNPDPTILTMKFDWETYRQFVKENLYY